jgi:hypothetical protein
MEAVGSSEMLVMIYQTSFFRKCGGVQTHGNDNNKLK